MSGGFATIAGAASLGNVTLTGGRLVGLAGSSMTAAAFTVSQGATFGSAGTVTGNIAVAGTLSPGASPGTMTVNGNVVLEELVCDGVLVATPAGSTAYNFSAQGPILPLGSTLLALTPISPFRPRRWRGALLPSRTRFRISVADPGKRPVSAVADYTEIRDVVEVEIWEDRDITLTLLFDPEHNLEERILKEQFVL